MAGSNDRCGAAKGLGTGSWYFPEGLLLLAGQTCKVRFFATCTVIILQDDARVTGIDTDLARSRTPNPSTRKPSLCMRAGRVTSEERPGTVLTYESRVVQPPTRLNR